jgi:KaiC/GvpD/RAD55 family RecA-like ATPase/CheY-like chemotaxis protein
MIRTGMEPWDRRQQGLPRGRYYLLTGAPGAGKSTAALHFLGAGLEAGEVCALLMQDDPADVVAHAGFLGYDFAPAAADETLQMLRFRLDFQRSYSRVAHPEVVFSELKALLAERMPERLVIDSMLPFLEGGLAAEERVDAFAQFLESLPCTTYVTLPGDLSESYYRRIHDRLTANAGGILHFELGQGGGRRLTPRKLRQQGAPVEPLDFVIRPGAGVVQDLAMAPVADLPDALRRRLVVLGAGADVPEHTLAALHGVFEVVRYDSVTRAFAELATARYGALLVGLDPLHPDPAIGLARELRAAGNGAPLLFVASAKGLRGSTRAQGLRAGGDDFLTHTLSPAEFIARIDAVRGRGHRRSSPGVSAAAPPFEQPADAGGTSLPLPPAQFRAVLAAHIADAQHAFFAVAVLGRGTMPPAPAWRKLRQRVRVADGDVVSFMEDGRFAVYLHDVHRPQVRELLRRLLDTEPGLADAESTELFCYPSDRELLSRWLSDVPQTALQRTTA